MSELRNNLTAVAEFLVVAVCTLAFGATCVGIIGSLLGHNAAGTRDFVEYWAAGQLIVHHANPYDSAALLRLERSAGFPSDIPAIIIGNPPSALPLVFPLGFLSPMAGEFLWLMLLLACLAASVRMIGVMHGCPKTRLNILGYTFAPALSCLLSGQVTIFLLFGLVLFLRLHRSHPVLAGGSLWFCMLKPQLFLPFGVVLLVWAIASKSYKVLVGAAAMFGGSIAVALIFDPLIWLQYSQMMRTERLDRLSIPCFSVLLRIYVSPHTLWLQGLPAVLGCAWALAYFRKHRAHWDWLEHGSLLMLVSVLVAPYTWFMDQVVVIPALLHATYTTRSRVLIALLALASAVIEIELFLGASPLHSVLYFWTAPAWLAYYLVATRPSPAMNDYNSPSLENGALLTAAKD